MSKGVSPKMDLVKLDNGEVFTTSRVIADKFGKRHDNVIRDIEKIIENIKLINKNTDTLNFEEIFYKDKYGREQKMYQLDKDAFSLLVMGFTGNDALRWKLDFINAFNLMLDQIHQSTKEKIKGYMELSKATNYYKTEKVVAHAKTPRSKVKRVIQKAIIDLHKELKKIAKVNDSIESLFDGQTTWTEEVTAFNAQIRAYENELKQLKGEK